MAYPGPRLEAAQMAGRMEFQFQFGGKKREPSFGSAEPKLRVLLIGDFSGRQARGASEASAELTQRPLLRVDVDGFDQTMGKVAPAIDGLTFGTLDDFHPDRLCQRLEVLGGFRALRARLLDPSTFAATAAALEPSSPAAAARAPDGTLDRLLCGQRSSAGR